MLPQHEYSWGDRQPLSAVRDLPSRQVRPPVGGADCVSRHRARSHKDLVGGSVERTRSKNVRWAHAESNAKTDNKPCQPDT